MIHLAIIWHQHQPLYRDLLAPVRGSIRMPWVRLHAIRDYFSMARIVSQHPGVQVTINWSPSLLLQLEDQLAGSGRDQIVTVVLDGENAWSAYRDDGRPFLHALYAALETDPDIRTVTPAAFIDGDHARSIESHPLDFQTRVHDLFTGSWIDEAGSAPGVDLGTWIGEPEENRAWALLGDARRDLASALSVPTPVPNPSYQALLAAEGSDWFWWLGDDQDSGHDPDFDDLFRLHLATAYRAAGRPVPDAIRIPIVPREPVWTFTCPVEGIFVGDGLVIRTNCPGVVRWLVTGPVESGAMALSRVGGVMAGVHRYQGRIGPFHRAGEIVFHFECRHPGCDCRVDDACCRMEPALVAIRDRGKPVTRRA